MAQRVFETHAKNGNRHFGLGRVNDFCRNPRIAGKAFSQISSDELEQLAVKLRSIRRKGGLKEKKKEEVKQPAAVTYMLIDTKAPKN